jgi:hypothetical protein
MFTTMQMVRNTLGADARRGGVSDGSIHVSDPCPAENVAAGGVETGTFGNTNKVGWWRIFSERSERAVGERRGGGS